MPAVAYNCLKIRKRIAVESPSNIKSVFNSQKNYKYSARSTDAKYRLGKLKMFRDLMVTRREDICKALREDFNKPEVETDLTEILPVISMINLLEKKLSKWMKDEKVKTPLLFTGTKSWIRREAKGNCLIISPWNYPFQLTVYPILTAFSAGNTCIVKPSEYTPSTNKIIIELCSKVFSPDEVSIFEGEANVSKELLELPFDHIFFTGSTGVGKVVMDAAAKSLASVSLELGGKSPCVMDRDIDLETMCRRVAWGKLVNSGQTCVAPDYLIVYESELEKVVEALKRSVNDFYPTSNFQENKDYSQIITERHGERLKNMVDEALSDGAKLHLGGGYNARVMEPTVISNVTNNMKVMEEEIFGPVLPIVTVKSEDEILDFINSKDNALGIYVFSKSEQFIEKVLSNTSTGGVTVNDTLLNVGHPHLPFGGAGKSGIGKYHGKFGFDEFSNLRPVLKRNLDIGTSFFYPPYPQKKGSIVSFLIKKLSKLF